jgi:hypothetical protein
MLYVCTSTSNTTVVIIIACIIASIYSGPSYAALHPTCTRSPLDIGNRQVSQRLHRVSGSDRRPSSIAVAGLASCLLPHPLTLATLPSFLICYVSVHSLVQAVRLTRRVWTF